MAHPAETPAARALRIVPPTTAEPAPPGKVRGKVVESPWYVGGKTQLVAVDWEGNVMAWELADTGEEYDAASKRLWHLVETAPRPRLSVESRSS